MGRKKKLCISCLLIILGLVGVILLFVYYPTLNLYFLAYETGQEVILYTDKNGKQQQGLGPKNTPVPESSGDTEGGKGSSYIDEVLNGGRIKYTIEDVTFYSTMREAHISPEECVPMPSLDEYRDTSPFMLVTFEVENIDAKLNADDEIKDAFILNVWADVDLNILNEDERENLYFGAEICYFSGHPPITDTSSDYFYFSLGQGQTEEFQIGIFMEQSVYDAQAAYIGIGTRSEEKYFNPFDASFI